LQDTIGHEIIRATKYIHHKIEYAISSLLVERDLTASQSHVLMCIMDGGDVYSSEIQKRMNISRAAVSGLIKKLRANGYIIYESCENDERHKKISVTEKAVQHKVEIDRCIASIDRTVFTDFTDEEMETLHRLIKKMVNNTKLINKE
jgi:DNA-binding MarR family transcriptional regulator